MANRHKSIFLYLTLACFLGLVAIFVFDGYMGLYDTLSITTGEREQTIETDRWQKGETYWAVGTNRGEKASFTYEIDNRRFSSYTADIEVSLWQSQEKVRDLITQQISAGAFGKGQIKWTLDTTELIPGDSPPEQRYQYTIVIKRGELERRIIWDINPAPYPLKAPPARSG